MKLKAIVILLNAVLGAAFVVIFFSPLVALGTDFFGVFWSRNWAVAVVFLAALAAVDAYFLLNWRLFRGLEKEDWGAVATFLEKRIFSRRRPPAGRVRLLLNTYLVTSNTDGVLGLEAWLAKRAPRLVAKYSVSFGIPHLLSHDPAQAEEFFRGLLRAPRLAHREWMAWNHAFCLLQLKRPADAAKELADLSERAVDPVLLLLTAYLMDVPAKGDPALEERVAALRARLRQGRTPQSVQRDIEREAGNMQVVVLAKLLRDAVEWLFAGAPRPGAKDDSGR